jgi:hypothetical protein
MNERTSVTRNTAKVDAIDTCVRLSLRFRSNVQKHKNVVFMLLFCSLKAHYVNFYYTKM